MNFQPNSGQNFVSFLEKQANGAKDLSAHQLVILKDLVDSAIDRRKSNIIGQQEITNIDWNQYTTNPVMF